jgi:peptidoglycan/xylan/chitin deacetylase (PgdA/CDA1 family)
MSVVGGPGIGTSVRVPAFVYHDVLPDTDATDTLAVSAHSFERQIARLSAAGYKGIGASDWAAYCRGGRRLPPKPVLITLDDAYEDLVFHALPLLRKYGFGATVFVITDKIGGVWEGRRAMSAAQIREWSGKGIEFGAHTRTHPDLRTVSGALLRDEIVGSRDDLARILGCAPAAFAYPYGEFTNEAVACARSAFRVAFSTKGGLNTSATTPHLLHRCVVFQNSSVAMIRWGALTGFNPVYEIRKALGVRRRLQALRRITASLSKRTC